MLLFDFYGEDNVESFDSAIRRLRLDMDELVHNDIPEAEVLEYCICAIKSARCEEHYSGLLWALAYPDEMPSDARVAYAYVPTYIISGILMYAWCRYESVRTFPDIGRILPLALEGCTGRDFMGHGSEAEEGFRQTMEIFEQCRVPEFVWAYPSVCPAFTELYTQAYRRWKNISGKEPDNACEKQINKKRNINTNYENTGGKNGKTFR